jgi:hypothetical protein
LGELFFGTRSSRRNRLVAISDSGHEMDALGHAGDEGRRGHERAR